MSAKKFLALGDSYTIGESVKRENSWPIHLKEVMKSQISLDVKIIATTGWTTDELAEAIHKENISETFDMVSLLIGVNNQYRRRSAEEYRKEFVELLEQAIVFASNDPNKVMVISIPDWGVTPFAAKDERSSLEIGEQIDLYNKINAEEASRKHCYYVDITPISKKASVESELTADDGLHPSAKMYTMWVEKISPVAFKILNN
ncbi:SGNH/GDSL hydrolase family protein [Candidatus Uabimicrobium amorphum]|uniref:Lysophospholipase n=1 Tax=Uabimicrobium amorphum TaxID=2596890 RepID=A0A5S9IN52_UABAM|nr:SGNH/GDSL hydrolase family protein [Candidatus Uabimicrobium amorphum]BBM84973.1 lysophospholipase [Candidatus Uabimicrobium amorphum]